MQVRKRKFSCFSKLLFFPQCSFPLEKKENKKIWENCYQLSPFIVKLILKSINQKQKYCGTTRVQLSHIHSAQQHAFNSATYVQLRHFILEEKDYFKRKKKAPLAAGWEVGSSSAHLTTFVCSTILRVCKPAAGMKDGPVGCQRLHRQPGECDQQISWVL